MSTKPRSVPQSNWDQHKETILKLYLTDDLSIAELAQGMQEHHGFSATISQYEAQLRSWSARKNLKKREWESVFRSIVPLESQGAQYRVLVSGHPLSPNRINRGRRYLKSDSRSNKRPRLETHSEDGPEGGSGDAILVQTLDQDGEWSQYVPAAQGEEIPTQPSTHLDQGLDIETSVVPSVVGDIYASTMWDSSLSTQYPEILFSQGYAGVFPQLSSHLTPDSMPQTWTFAGGDASALQSTNFAFVHPDAEILELQGQYNNAGNISLSSMQSANSPLQSLPIAPFLIGTINLKCLPFEQFERQLASRHLSLTSSFPSPTCDSRLLSGPHHRLMTFITSTVEFMTETNKKPASENYRRVRVALRRLESTIPQQQKDWGSNITRQPHEALDVELHRLLLYSAVNGFAGMDGVPIEHVFRFLNQTRNITSSWSRLLQGVPNHIAKSLAESLFRAAIESGDYQATKFFLQTGLVNANSAVCFAENRMFTPLERAACLQKLSVIRELLPFTSNVDQTFGGDLRSHRAEGALGCLIIGNCPQQFADRNHSTFSSEYLATVDALLKAGSRVHVIFIAIALRRFVRMCLAKRLLGKLAPSDHSKAISRHILYFLSEELSDEEADGAITNIISNCEQTGCNRCLDKHLEEVDWTIISGARRGHIRLVRSLFWYATSPTRVLSAAIRGGNRDLIEFVLAQKPDFHHAAVESIDRSTHGIEYLITHATKPSTTPLAEAIDAGDEALIRTLEYEGVSKHPDTTTYTPDRLRPAIFAAVKTGNVEFLKKALCLGAGNPGIFLYGPVVHERVIRFFLNVGVTGLTPYDGFVIGVYKLGNKSIFSELMAHFPDYYFISSASPISCPIAKEMNSGNMDMFQAFSQSGSLSRKFLTGCLVLAIKRDDGELLRHLLELGADATNEDALCVAAKGHVDMLRIVLQHFPLTKHAISSRVINNAIGGTNGIEALGLLLASSVIDLNNQEHRGNPSPITVAVKYEAGTCDSDFPLTARLIDAGCNINQVTSDGSRITTPLLLAIQGQNKSLVQFLISHGAKINTGTLFGVSQTPLQAAAETGNLDIVKLLIEQEALINQKPASFGGGTALQFAAMSGNCNIAAIILDNGAELHAPPSTFNGRWPLEGAAEHGRLDMIQFLWNASDFGFPIEQCQRAIQLAGENGHGASQDLIRELAVSGGIMLTLEGTGLS